MALLRDDVAWAFVAVNAEQAEDWNGASGREFTEQHERHERVLGRMRARSLAAAAIQDGEYLLDVGRGCGETAILAARAAFSGTDAQARRDHRASADRLDYGRGPRTVEYLRRGAVHAKHQAERTFGRREPVHVRLTGTAGRHDDSE